MEEVEEVLLPEYKIAEDAACGKKLSKLLISNKLLNFKSATALFHLRVLR